MRRFLYVDIQMCARVLSFSRVRNQRSPPILIEIRGFLKAESDCVEFPVDRFEHLAARSEVTSMYFLGISCESSLHCFQCEESPWAKVCK